MTALKFVTSRFMVFRAHLAFTGDRLLAKPDGWGYVPLFCCDGFDTDEYTSLGLRNVDGLLQVSQVGVEYVYS